MKKKICVITGSRAEYGLLYPLIKKIQQSEEFDLQIIVTGMHLSPEFGLTYKEIEEDGFEISEKVEILLSADTPTSVNKSIGLGLIGITDSLKRLSPDFVVLLGDRFEIFSAAIAAFIMRIPIVHLHGGELTQGSVDEGIRHSITKLSYLHFVSTEVYRKRVIQLGESPERVFNVGALGLDNIKNLKLLEKDELERVLNYQLERKTILLTFHPVTLEDNTSEKNFREILKALDQLKDYNIIFTKPNADTGGRIIAKLIDNYVSENPKRAIALTSLGKLKYLSLMKYVDIIMGNSSSGIIEAPSFKKPTINIGDRQKGRVKAESVIDCEVSKESIIKAVKKAEQMDLSNVKNPYGDGNTSIRIIDILEKQVRKGINLKKEFYDINF